MAKRPRRRFGSYIPKSLEQIRALALFVRELGRISDQHVPNISIFLENLRRTYPHLQLIYVDSDKLPPGVEAQAFPKLGWIKAARRIEEALARNENRARWTIIHELGHILLGHPKKPNRGSLNKSELDNLLEKEANDFAAELLAPIHLAIDHKTSEEIRKSFRLHTFAAKLRLDEINTYKLVQRKYTVPSNDNFRSYFVLMQCAYPNIVEAINQVRRNNAIALDDTLRSPREAAEIVICCAALLLSAYSSVREIKYVKPYHLAAAIIAAIISVRPIREDRSDPIDNALLANKLCALTSVIKLLQASSSDNDWKFYKRLCHSSIRFEDCGYLHDYRQTLVARISRSERLAIGSIPDYKSYNKYVDVSWTEIKSLEALFNVLKILRKSI